MMRDRVAREIASAFVSTEVAERVKNTHERLTEILNEIVPQGGAITIVGAGTGNHTRFRCSYSTKIENFGDSAQAMYEGILWELVSIFFESQGCAAKEAAMRDIHDMLSNYVNKKHKEMGYDSES